MPQQIINHLLRFDPDSVRTLQAVSRSLKHLSSAFLGLSQREMRAQCGDVDSPLYAVIHCSTPLASGAVYKPAAFHRFLPEKIRRLGLNREECPDKILSPQEMSRFNQKILDSHLQKIWSSVHRLIVESDPSVILPPIGSSGGEIHFWMHQNHPVMQNLTRINLNRLDLSWVPTQIRLCANLQVLSLNHNCLGTLLPNTFQGMQNLKMVHLYENQISDLPPKIFHGLTGLEQICLFGNQLKTLPHNLFNGLVNLREILLGFNRLESLPPTLFHGLTSLQVIYLNNNQLYTLPPHLFHGNPQLRLIYLHENPLLVTWDSVWREFSPFYSTTNQKFFNYRCESTIARFYQLVAGDASPEVLWQSFQKLDDSFKNALLTRVRGEGGHATQTTSPLQMNPDQLFGDMQALRKVLKGLVRGWYGRLSQAQKKCVYKHLTVLAFGENHTLDPQWGKDHIFDHVLRLIDAMCRLHWPRRGRSWSQAFPDADPE